MSTILVPVDFSLASYKALEYAKSMMDKKLDTLLVFHVYSLPIPDPQVPFELLSNLTETYSEIAENHINKLVKRCREEENGMIEVTGKAVAGSAIDAILEEAKLCKADLIVMGMRGKNKALRKIMGTTATRVIQQTKIPVVVVPEHAAYSPIKKIAYASNLEEEDIMAMDRVIRLANQLNASVHCVHIQKKAEELDTYKKNILEEAYQHDSLQSPINIDIISNENIVEGLNTYVETQDIDLIVMLTHHRSIFNRILAGSSTWDMAFQSKIPVWVFNADSPSLSIHKAKKDYVKAE